MRLRLPVLRLPVLAWLIALVLPASAIMGCPICDSETGQEVRAGIFDEDFAANLVMVLLPFPVLLGIVAMIYFGVPLPRRKETEHGD